VPRSTSGLLPLATLVALLLAGCGGSQGYSLAKTRECLASRPGLRLAPPPARDVVASAALGGALEVRTASNAVVISFAQDDGEAGRIAAAYRRFRGRSIGIEDILRPRRNAVLLWRAHPSPEDEAAVSACLR
jgi:hypothetical protein